MPVELTYGLERIAMYLQGVDNVFDLTWVDGVRYRDATFLPDGKSLVALSDASGEVEVVKLSADGLAERNSHTGR